MLNFKTVVGTLLVLWLMFVTLLASPLIFLYLIHVVEALSK